MNGLGQDQRSIFVLTKSNLDEHNREGRLGADPNTTLSRHQQFERFRQVAMSLGIDLSDSAFAGLWEGWNGSTPMERFTNNPGISSANAMSKGNVRTSDPQ
jgi:hypothetical protein